MPNAKVRFGVTGYRPFSSMPEAPLFPDGDHFTLDRDKAVMFARQLFDSAYYRRVFVHMTIPRYHGSTNSTILELPDPMKPNYVHNGQIVEQVDVPHPGWRFMHLLKYVHGQDTYVDQWRGLQSYPTRSIPDVYSWTVTLPDESVLYPNASHPLYQAFVQDRLSIAECSIHVVYVDETTQDYIIEKGEMQDV